MIKLYMKNILPASIALALTACGGGNGGSSTILSGTITNFGSVFVNGVELETNSSSFDIDGMPGIQDDLAVGMIVNVTGTVNDDGISGDALTISFDDQIQGPVSGLGALVAGATKRTFSVLGTEVSINRMDTVLDISGQAAAPPGTAFSFSDIANNNNIEISGFFDASGILHATRVELKDVVFDAASIVEVKGTIAALNNGIFTLDGLTVDAGAAAIDDLPGGLQEGVFVEVKGTFDVATNTITATRVEAVNRGIGDANKVSIEGIITDFVDDDEFRLNGQRVDASNATLFPPSLVLANNLRVEAEGPIVGGILQAITVELRGGENRVHAKISAVNSESSSFEMMPVTGQPSIIVTINATTEMRDDVDKIKSFGVDALVVGDFAEVRGFAEGTAISATRVRVRENDDVIVQGIRQSGATSGFIKVLGVEFAVASPGETHFEDANDNVIAQAQFNQAAPADDTTLIKVKDKEAGIGSGIGNGIADEAEIEH